MKIKTIKGWVIWTRNTTPMEDGWCRVFRAKSDAMDWLHGHYFNSHQNLWRIARVTMTCEVPVRPKKAKVRRAR